MRISNNSASIFIKTLIDSIQKQTKLSDWGDKQFLVPLMKLGEAFFEEETNEKRKPSAETFWNDIRRLLTNRLLVQNELNLHPDILEIPIERPLFIIGALRSGTTLLHHLLAQDPLARAPLYWEMLFPVPYEGLANLAQRNA